MKKESISEIHQAITNFHCEAMKVLEKNPWGDESFLVSTEELNDFLEPYYFINLEALESLDYCKYIPKMCFLGQQLIAYRFDLRLHAISYHHPHNVDITKLDEDLEQFSYWCKNNLRAQNL